MRTAIAAAASVVLSAAIGYVTSLVAAHPTTGAVTGLIVLVVLGGLAALVQNIPVLPWGKKSAVDPSGGQSPSAVPIDYAVTDPAPIFQAVDVDGFIGRQWLVRKLDSFMASNRSGYFLVEADAGMGKTAFAAWLVKTRGYLFYFSRLSGRSERGALQNLSAQVIKKCRLEGKAQGGFVPEWALLPANFQALLGQAAGRLGDKDSLVLVVDGLDDADSVADGMPFGLPMLLPPRVYVVATYRTGSPPRHTEPSETVRIGQDDSRNIGDIRSYLSAAADGKVLAGRLAEARISKAAFVDLLTERCEGVWVYLRYVLAEIRDGSRPPDAIAELPVGLQAYYAEQVARWRHDVAWTGGLLPLLATLGSADEALPAATLAELAGDLDQAAVRRWCGTTLRPLLTITTAQASGDERLFEIYHASLREVLRGEIPQGTEGEPLENALELRQATIAAHGRIADRYLQLFGGLDGGLARLAENPGLGQADGGYPLRHLAQHLQQANRADDLFCLLRTEHPADSSRIVNVWYQTQDAADYLGHYMDDLHRADGVAGHTTDQLVGRHERAPSLGQEIAYALMAASIVSRTKNIPPALVRCAVEAALWSPARSLDHARRLPDPADRVRALLAIRPHLAPGEQPGVVAEALTNAADIREPEGRISALTRVAESLPPDQQADVFRQALAVITTLEWHNQPSALRALAPHLPADVLPQALRMANSTTGGEYYRAQALSGLVPFLGPQEQRQAITDALTADRAVYDDGFRGEALTTLAPYLPADLLDEALAFAATLPDNRLRAAALTALAPRLAPGDRPRVVQQAREAALAIDYDTFRFEALIALAPALPPDQQRDALLQALEGATAEGYGGTRADLLIAMAPHLPPNLLTDSLTTANAIEHEADRVRALAGLVDSLPADQRPGALRQAVDALKSDRWLLDDKGLSALVPHLPADLLAEVLDAAIAVPFDDFRARALSLLAPHLSADLLAKCLAAVTIRDDPNRAGALRVLASYLKDDDQRAVQSVALDTAFAITEFLDRRMALDRLLPSLNPGLLDRALTLCRAMTDEAERARALVQLAIGRPADGQAAVVEEALGAARHVTDAGTRADLLTALAYRLPEDRRPAVTEEVLGMVPQIGYEPTRATVLASLGGLLAEDQFAQARAFAAAIKDNQSQAAALTALANSAPADRRPELLDQALAAAAAIGDGADRIKALITLAAQLAADKRDSALRKALDAALAADIRRDEQLALVVPLLPPPLVAEAAAVVTARQPGPDARELAAVAPFLPADQQQDVLRKGLEAARLGDFSGEGLAALAPQLPPDLLPEAAAIARNIGYDAGRVEALTAVGGHLPADQQAAIFREALQDVSAIAYGSTRASALQTLATQLPADLLAEALALSPKSTADPTIAVLNRASTVIPPDRVSDYVQLLRPALAGFDRAACLTIIASTAEAISYIGGDVAIKACANAICDVDRWWP